MSLSMKFRELFIFANFEVPDSDQKICDKNDKEYCHTEMKTTKKISAHEFSA